MTKVLEGPKEERGYRDKLHAYFSGKKGRSQLGMCSTTSSMAKWWCTQKQCEIVDECLQFFGGYGYMLEYPIARLYADARVQKIYGGTNEIMKELIARGLD